MSLLKLAFSLFLLVPVHFSSQIPAPAFHVPQAKGTDWVVNDLVSATKTGIKIAGKPESVPGKYGKSLSFNGSTDGIFLDQMPLEGLNKFTVEIILCPYSGGNFEQRYFHCGELRGDRVMLELRSVSTGWYLDAYVKSGNQQKTLIDSTRLHPHDRWTHIAFVVDQNKQSTYVNGLKELESQIRIEPLTGGKTSVGVRQNEKSWFKGAIYRIRISPEALNPLQFLPF
jgi:hypothetical protein